MKSHTKLAETKFLGEAIYSPCQKYRYRLERPIVRDLLDRPITDRHIVFIMLNPSTATETVNDPTVAKCCVYSRSWGYSRLTVVNIFAWRSTDPKGLGLTDDPVGPDNDKAIIEAATRADAVVCAWGRHGKLMNRGRQVTGMLLDNDIELYKLQLNEKSDNSPGHPLYLPLSLTATRWHEADEFAQRIN